jgi:AhpD family alkylhydroperoxidase
VDDLPLLPGVLQCAVDGILPGGIERNREAARRSLRIDPGCPPELVEICFDAQTSGGLLVAIPEENGETFLKLLRENDSPEATIIGKVRDFGTPEVILRTSKQQKLPPPREFVPSESEESLEPSATNVASGEGSSCCEPAPCCSEGSEFETSSSCCENAEGKPAADGKETFSSTVSKRQPPGDGAASRFFDFMSSVNAPGLLGERTKQAISIALSVAQKCEPCLKSHIRKARKMGMSEEEIDEAAWMGIAFGGAPTMMFYKTVRRE